MKREIAILLLAADTLAAKDARDTNSALRYAGDYADTVDNNPLWANGRHCGDCTKEPHTCARCVFEQYLAIADELWCEDLPSLFESVMSGG